MNCGNRVKLSSCGLAFAFGITKALCVFLFAMGNMYYGYGDEIMHMMTSLYPHFGATVIGGLWGALWGFLEGFVFGLVVAFIYNCICCWCCRR